MIVRGFTRAAFVTRDNRSIGGSVRFSRRKLAQVLKKGPLTREELATAAGFKIQPMNRLLNHPWFEVEDGRVVLTDEGRKHNT